MNSMKAARYEAGRLDYGRIKQDYNYAQQVQGQQVVELSASSKTT